MRLLVTGFPRSGTTILGRILEGIDGAHYVHEPFNTHYPAPGSVFRSPFNLYRLAPESKEGCKQLRGLRALVEGRRGFAELRRRDFTHPVDLVRRVIRSVGRSPWSQPGSTLVFKDPTAFYSADLLAEEFGFIPVVTIRDPIEVIGSFLVRSWEPKYQSIFSQEAVQPFFCDSLRESIRRLEHQQGEELIVASVSILWSLGHRILLDRVAEMPSGVVLSHADLVRDPIGAVKLVLDRLGLAMTDECLRLIEKYCSSKEISGQSDVPPVLDVRRNLNSVGQQAREAMKDRHCGLVDSICGETFQRTMEIASVL